MYKTLITVQQLKVLQSSQQPCMVFDCSFDLMDPLQGDIQYQSKHIVGAVRADLNQHLSTKNSTDCASSGRHPLPSRDNFAKWLSSVGFRNGMQAVVYDRQGVNYCGRLWWMLKWVGHEATAVLDGGLQAWEDSQGVIEVGITFKENSIEDGRFELSSEKANLIQTQQLMDNLGRPNQTLVDARSPARFRGETEPLDPIAGHIPGALNRPFVLNLNKQGKFKSAEELRSEFLVLLAGRQPSQVIHHCGSGVSAVPNILAMEIAGLGMTGLYAGSWSEWCADPSRPIAQG